MRNYNILLIEYRKIIQIHVDNYYSIQFSSILICGIHMDRKIKEEGRPASCHQNFVWESDLMAKRGEERNEKC